MELFTELLLLFSFIIELVLGLIVLLKDRHKQVYQYFFGFMASCAFWSGFLSVALIYRDYYFDKLCIIAGLFGSAFFLLFSYAFSIKEKVPKKLYVPMLLIPTILFFPILLSNIIIGQTIFHSNGFIEGVDGPLVFIFYLYHFINCIFGFLFIIIGYKKAIGIKKVQFEYLLFGMSVIFGIFLITNLILPILKIYYFISLSSLFFIILALFFIYIISRYRFMDIRVVIKKTIVYIISFSLLISIIALLIFTANKYLLQSYNATNIIIIEVILIVIFLPMLKKLVLKVINKYIDKDEIDFSKNIAEFNNDISYSNYLDDLINKCDSFFKKELSIEKVDFIIRDFTKPELGYFFPLANKKILDDRSQDFLVSYFSSNKEVLLKQELPFIKADKKYSKELQEISHFLRKEGYEAIIAFKQVDVINGFILLGEKSDKQIFSQEDAKLLESIAEQVNLALFRVLSYEEAVGRVKREFGTPKPDIHN